MELTAENVQTIFRECSVQPDQSNEPHQDNTVTAEGIVHKAVFRQDILDAHQDDIRALLAQLPEEFNESGGGGWSFLNACNNRQGEQWTGLHQAMEQLMLLGLATGMVTYLLPREAWKALHGNVPYFIIHDRKTETTFS